MSIDYRMSNEDYHASAHIGSSTAKLALSSWQLFQMAMAGEFTRPQTPALSVGTDFHALVLEPHRARPLLSKGPINPKTQAPYGRGTQAWRKWKEEHPHAIVPDAWMLQSINMMPEEVRDELVQAGAHVEASVFQSIGGVNIKARPDLWNPSTATIYDLKKIAAADNLELAIERNIRQYKYWFSAAWYKAALSAETGQPHQFRLIFSEDGPPYRWRIVDLDFEYIAYAQEKVSEVLSVISSGNYPQEDIYHTATLPKYMAFEGEE